MTEKKADTNWDDAEILLHKLTPDTKFVFDRMTAATLEMVEAKPGEVVMDLACGRAADAQNLARSGAVVFGLEPSDIMIQKALEINKPQALAVILLRGLAEALPLTDNCLDKLVCKGAIDHFADVDMSLKEAARVLKPGGKLIISVANFASLSCILARVYDFGYEKLKGRMRTAHPSYLPPEDHNFKFDRKFLEQKLKPFFEIETLTGLSLLWCFPNWGAALEKFSPAVQNTVLQFLDRLARMFPSLSDVLLVRARPKK
jgi:ubiquinone/menaquinone biosynthesis C-methylase UbiE